MPRATLATPPFRVTAGEARQPAERVSRPNGSAGRAVAPAVGPAVLLLVLVLGVDEGHVDVVPRVGPHLRVGVPKLAQRAALLVVAADEPGHARVGEQVDHPATALATGATLPPRVVKIVDAGQDGDEHLATVVGGLHPVAHVVTLAAGEQAVVLGVVQALPQHRGVLGFAPRDHRQGFALMTLTPRAPEAGEWARAVHDRALVEPATSTADDPRAAHRRSLPEEGAADFPVSPPALGARRK